MKRSRVESVAVVHRRDDPERPVRLRRLVVLLMLVTVPAFAERTLVVYLPDAPVESSKKLAESVTDLQQMVSAKSGVRFDLKFFRKAEDCAAYLSASAGNVAIVVAPPEFLADTAPDLTPILQFSRDGKDSYHRIVIVKSSDAAKSLADLRGRSVSKIQTAGARAAELESRVVLRGESGFRTVIAPDDLAAAANVIYGGSDAALVSEHNPFATSHLGKDLRVIYTSPAIPLPVVAIRAQAFSDHEREMIEQAFVGAGGTLAALQVSRFERLPGGRTLLAMIGGETTPKPAEEKKLEIAAVPLDAIELPSPSTALLTAPAIVAIDFPVIPLPERQ
jgi:ABC-type phosphate/phosphonate transport system substrate-binding protein